MRTFRPHLLHGQRSANFLATFCERHKSKHHWSYFTIPIFHHAWTCKPAHVLAMIALKGARRSIINAQPLGHITFNLFQSTSQHTLTMFSWKGTHQWPSGGFLFHFKSISGLLVAPFPFQASMAYCAHASFSPSACLDVRLLSCKPQRTTCMRSVQSNQEGKCSLKTPPSHIPIRTTAPHIHPLVRCFPQPDCFPPANNPPKTAPSGQVYTPNPSRMPLSHCPA